ncbi:MAG TPA: Crp/Fnr family transcriptional regulator [Cyclobacteriaceae bacterium]|nr:Crp/Fnr family transcriptional regulator [Cyclobacteriaceae bacterium]HMV08481.1 Crp/Fnr family transcriptional regulator [Cyclobacteriaceae bacterium]HMV89192.1 Crp/Fnr family transcriptional regulator [Cyclobacteriaceae bacterium]HMX01254.1 Crp/Fnr family transcriptional regulator [Cyclobacteriaceae bacterium]HMX51332.1 Crp/Fnr family transcriptional regulator [Cyclobacteriaceae bacterium]
MLTNFPPGNSRLKAKQLFEGLPPEEINKLLSEGATHVFRKGEIIFREGGIPTGVFHIKSGKVKKYKTTATGAEQIIYICAEGELLGYHALLSEERYSDSTAALVTSEITFISKETFLGVLSRSSALSNRLLKLLGLEFSGFIDSFTNLATKNVRERLAFNLLMLEEKFRDGKKTDAVDIMLSRTDLANMTGTAKETLVRLLKEFKQKNLIQTTSNSVRIIDREGVIAEANFMGKQTPGKK